MNKKLKNALEPLIKIRAEFLDTVKPYKNKNDEVEDLFQCFRGIGNIIVGAFSLALWSVAFLVRFIFFNPISPFFFGKDNKWDYFFKETKASFETFGFEFLNGMAKIIKGIVQIITSPLALVIRLPIKAIRTAVTGYCKVEDTVELELLAEDTEEVLAQAEEVLVTFTLDAKAYEVACFNKNEETSPKNPLMTFADDAKASNDNTTSTNEEQRAALDRVKQYAKSVNDSLASAAKYCKEIGEMFLSRTTKVSLGSGKREKTLKQETTEVNTLIQQRENKLYEENVLSLTPNDNCLERISKLRKYIGMFKAPIAVNDNGEEKNAASQSSYGKGQ